MKTVSIRVNDDLVDKLDEMAKREDRDRSYLINKAIKSYINHEEYILEQIYVGIKDIKEGKVHSFEEVKKEMDKYMKDKI